MAKAITCTPKRLPPDMVVVAAAKAIEINPVNRPAVERLVGVVRGFRPTRERLSVLTTKYWGSGGVQLTVGFLDNPPADLRKKILAHMNAWDKTANVTFTESRGEAQVRIARLDTPEDGGYWSYVGTDVLSIDAGQPTMNLEGFTMNTSDAEFHRVVRHETGHTLGFPHEHMRRELVDRIDRKKAIRFYKRNQGWSPAEVDQQVLTPIEEGSLLSTDHADPNSIMCYQIPGSITKDGEPILGGLDINAADFKFAGKIYPKKPATSRPKAARKK